MKPAGKIIGEVLVGLTLLLCVFSCIMEDQSDCPPMASQSLSVMLNMVPDGADLTPTSEDLKLAAVYLFDGEGSLFATWTKQNPALNTSYDTGIVLEEGKNYRMVVWINPIEPYSITPPYTTRSELSEGRIELAVPSSGEVTGLIPMLLYGSMDAVSALQTEAPLGVPISFDTHQISITMKGFLSDETYTLRISDINVSFDFNNQPIQTSGFTYLSEFSTPDEAGNSVVMLRILRLDRSRSPQISIVDSSGTIVFPVGKATSVDLMDLLDQVGINPNTMHFLNIEVELPQPGASTMTIYINGWKVVLDGYIVY